VNSDEITNLEELALYGSDIEVRECWALTRITTPGQFAMLHGEFDYSSSDTETRLLLLFVWHATGQQFPHHI
jgi:hypothetical protein